MKRNKVQDLRVSDFMTTDLVTVAPDDTIGDALGKMKTHDVHELPVLERKRLVGVVTLRELMRRRNLPPTAKVSTVLQVPPELTPDTLLPEAAEKMISTGFRAIPVAKGKSLVGILSPSDLVRALVETKALEGVVAKDFMTPNPQAVAENDTVELMAKNHISSVVVTEKDEPVGIITTQDLMQFLAALREREQLYVEISGLEDEPPEAYDDIYAVIQKEMRRIAELVEPRTFAI